MASKAPKSAPSPFLPFMDAHAKALKMNLKDLTVEALKSLFDMCTTSGAPLSRLAARRTD